MKTVNITFYKPSGKFYCHEDAQISEQIEGGTSEYWNVLRSLHRIPSMVMVVTDSDDNKEPYIVPHLFKPLEGGE